MTYITNFKTSYAYCLILNSICHMVFYLISNLFCFNYITRQQFVLKYSSVFIKLLYLLTFTFAIKIFFKFSSPRNIILICPKLKSLKHINKEIDSSLVVVEYIPFLSNLSK